MEDRKQCSGCKTLLPLTDYDKDRHGPNGLSCRCKECRKKTKRKRTGSIPREAFDRNEQEAYVTLRAASLPTGDPANRGGMAWAGDVMSWRK